MILKSLPVRRQLDKGIWMRSYTVGRKYKIPKINVNVVKSIKPQSLALSKYTYL